MRPWSPGGRARGTANLAGFRGDHPKLPDAQEDAVPVKRRERKSFENEEIERALQEVETIGHKFS